MSLFGKWKFHFSSMSKPEEQDEWPTHVPVPIKKTVSKVSSLKKTDLRTLLIVRELLKKEAFQAVEKRRAHDIKEIDQSEYSIKTNSIEAFIMRVLFASEEPIHINRIIEQIEALGWKSNSIYHKYKQVYDVLTDSSYMFQNTGGACFKLREGFRGRLPEKTERSPLHERTETIPTIKDIVINVSKTFATKNGVYPGQVHYIMGRCGIECSYGVVYRIMQTNAFVKNGFWYRLNDAVCCPSKASPTHFEKPDEV